MSRRGVWHTQPANAETTAARPVLARQLAGRRRAPTVMPEASSSGRLPLLETHGRGCPQPSAIMLISMPTSRAAPRGGRHRRFASRPLPIDAVGQLKALEFNARRRGTLGVLRRSSVSSHARQAHALVRQLRPPFSTKWSGYDWQVVGTSAAITLRLARYDRGRSRSSRLASRSDIAQLLNGLAKPEDNGGKFLNGLGADVDPDSPAARHRQVQGGFQRRNPLGRRGSALSPPHLSPGQQPGQPRRRSPGGRGRTRRIRG